MSVRPGCHARRVKAVLLAVFAALFLAGPSPGAAATAPQDGQTLTAAAGTWTGTTPITFGYQWQRCDPAGANCAPIAGAAAVSYTLSGVDVGSTIRVVVTGTNSAGSSSATSAQTAVVAGNPPVNTSPPTIGVTSALQADLFRLRLRF